MARVAVVQMVSSAHVHENLATLDGYFLTARDGGAELLVLPENFACMGLHETDKLAIAEEDGQGLIQHTVSQLAAHYGIWVIAGTLPIKAYANRVKASSYVYDAKGMAVARYDKIHLFDVRVSDKEAHQESATIEPGDRVVAVDTPVGRIGLTVCYDLRFPELYRELARLGVELFAVPSAFTAVTGRAHWDVLLRARAIEQLCYVLASNQGGEHASGRHTHGHSMIVEPWGQVLAEQKQGAGVVFADIDLQRIHQLRQQFPCHDHHVLHLQKVSSI
ncbi:MAG TPA: apolipoprotein acyltransferase [Legionella sp.]|nr:apolipoprotein acyltransferase [Legionella sp.]